MNTKYLVLSKSSGFAFQAIADLDDVKEIEESANHDPYELNNAEVAAITNISKKICCLHCKENAVTAVNRLIGKCSGCGAMLRLDKCERH